MARGKPVQWGFIGAGKMATALVSGMLRAGVVEAGRVKVSDRSLEAIHRLVLAKKILACATNVQLVQNCGVVVLAVKPQVMLEVLKEIAPAVNSSHLVISIAAGIPLSALRAELGEECRLARVMPNTPALVGAGASAYAMGQNATRADEALVRSFLEGAGLCFKVPETQLDAVTGLSGSGPAYIFQVIEALSDGGVRAGLPRDVATALAAQTVMGAAQMVLETGLHPGVLKDQVTSPGGTTITGLHALERGGLRAALMDAVEAATARSRELGRKSS